MSVHSGDEDVVGSGISVQMFFFMVDMMTVLEGFYICIAL